MDEKSNPRGTVIGTLLLLLCCSGSAFAAVPQKVNYQGFLTTPGNTPVTASVAMTFRIYSVATGGSPLHEETQQVGVASGLFNVALGTAAALTLPFDVPYFVGVTVGADPEMTPRQPLSSSPYALRAASADALAPGATVSLAQFAGGAAGQVLGGTGGVPAWTASPALAGELVLASPSTAATGNIRKGANRFVHDFGTGSTFVGELAGNFTMTGIGNTAFGRRALEKIASGSGNTAVGNTALAALETGSGNVAIGEGSLSSTTSGYNNVSAGTNAMKTNTTGYQNAATGRSALEKNTTGASNTATGAFALLNNTTGNHNTASGDSALAANTASSFNTATGSQSLAANTDGTENTGTGAKSLAANTTGIRNTAAGFQSLNLNTTGGNNAATGAYALESNVGGANNTADGAFALRSNASGSDNVAVGYQALYNATGSGNIAVGSNAGSVPTASSGNIFVGHVGVAGDQSTIRLGSTGGLIPAHARLFAAGVRGAMTGIGDAVPVVIDSAGQLGTINSSRRTKEHINDMASASSALMSLRPVTFRYRAPPDAPSRHGLQYGLIAEEVAAVYPELVARSANGSIETVMYQFLPPMLLNELQKQQRTIAAQDARIAALEARLSTLAALAERLAGRLHASVASAAPVE